MLDQRLGHRRIDVVVGHLVAHAVGAPPQGQLAEIAGAHDQRALMVGQPEEMGRAFAGLYILKGDVVERLTVDIGMAQILEHLQ